jgi:tetratricopeptide (TPR) repeat protein
MDEFGGKTGWFLFLSHRSVEVWAGARPAERKGLFTARSYVERTSELAMLDVEPEVRAALHVVTEMIGNPARADAYDVCAACRAIAAWAAGLERFDTARLFSEAAAMVVPNDARLLYEAGKYARQGANYPAAKRLLSLTLEVARRRADWGSYCRALSSLGIMHQRRGNFRTARRYHFRCYRIARKRKVADVAGEAAHDLFTVAAEFGDSTVAEEWACLALDAYLTGHPRLLMLAHDVAFFWFERGDYAKALSVFQALLPRFTKPSERVLVLSSIARCASILGASAEFDSSSSETLAMVESAAAIELAAQSLLDLAHGAAQLKQWDLAERTARRALDVARQRGEGRVQLEAEAVLDSAHRARTVELGVAHGHSSDQRLWRLMMECLKELPGAVEG